MLTIQIDTREKSCAIGKILRQFDRAGVKYFRSKLPVGDYMSLDNARRVIDRKQNLQELCGNVTQGHRRFTDELDLAHELGIEMMVLCEHSPAVKTLEDVKNWENPRLKISPNALTGERLYKILCSIEMRHHCKFLFCGKGQTGLEIMRLLGGEGNV